MKTADIIALAGGEQKDLLAVFLDAGIPVTKQAVSKWAKVGELPYRRQIEIMRLRPEWFGGKITWPAKKKAVRKRKVRPLPTRFR
jgi:hypothetical protein